jgi:hypothetical protein
MSNPCDHKQRVTCISDSSPNKQGILSRYVMLTLDTLSLGLPQSEVHTLEAAGDVETDDEEHSFIGWITAGGQRWPVHCLSKDLDSMKAIPSGRLICVLVANEGGYFGLLCDEIQTIEGKEFDWSPLPECMIESATPITSLVVRKGKVCCMTTAADLAAYMARWT